MNVAELQSLLHGAAVTVGVSVCAIVLGIPSGLALAIVRWRRVPVLAPLVAAYVSMMRATPSITLALMVFFALPSIGIDMDVTHAAVLTLLLNTAAFNCEIWRAALIDFPREELAACRAYGMTLPLAFRRIVLPQVSVRSLPALVNEMTLLIKSSPAIAVIGIVDLTRAASRIGAETYQPLPPMIAATLLYVAIVLVFVGAQRYFERRLRRGALQP